MGLTLSLAPSHFLKVLGRLSEDFVQHSFLASRDGKSRFPKDSRMAIPGTTAGAHARL